MWCLFKSVIHEVQFLSSSLPSIIRGSQNAHFCVKASSSEHLVHTNWSTPKCWRWEQTTPTLCFPVEMKPHLMFLDMQELSNIHEVYAKMKTAVAASSEQAVSSINLIRKNLAPDLHGTVMDFYKWQQKEVGHVWEDVWILAFARLSRVCCRFDGMPCLVRKRLMHAGKTMPVRERRHSRRSVQLSRCSCSSVYYSIVLYCRTSMNSLILFIFVVYFCLQCKKLKSCMILKKNLSKHISTIITLVAKIKHRNSFN